MGLNGCLFTASQFEYVLIQSDGTNLEVFSKLSHFEMLSWHCYVCVKEKHFQIERLCPLCGSCMCV